MSRYVKAYGDAKGMRLDFDLKTKKIISSFQNYCPPNFKKYEREQVIYDEKLVACFYNLDDHPHTYLLGREFVDLLKTFTSYGFTAILDNLVNGIAIVLLYPREKVKEYK